jgi:hypothetical protein
VVRCQGEDHVGTLILAVPTGDCEGGELRSGSSRCVRLQLLSTTHAGTRRRPPPSLARLHCCEPVCPASCILSLFARACRRPASAPGLQPPSAALLDVPSPGPRPRGVPCDSWCPVPCYHRGAWPCGHACCCHAVGEVHWGGAVRRSRDRPRMMWFKQCPS